MRNLVYTTLCFCLCIAETLYCQETGNLKHIRDALQRGECKKALEYCKTDSLNFPMSKHTLDREKLKQQALDCIKKIETQSVSAPEPEKERQEKNDAEEAEKKRREEMRKATDDKIIRARVPNREGIRQSNLGNYDEAIKFFTEAIDIFPRPEYYANRGETRMDIGDYKSAINDFNQAIQRSINNRKYYGLYQLLLGDAYCKLGKFQNAIQCYEKAIEWYDKYGDSPLDTDGAPVEKNIPESRKYAELKLKYAKEGKCL